MASLLIHIGLGGLVGAGGALVGGLIILALRVLLSKRIRSQQLEKIRQIGVVGATKQALFEVRQPELDFPKRAAS
jgi:hypothetical protein